MEGANETAMDAREAWQLALVGCFGTAFGEIGYALIDARVLQDPLLVTLRVLHVGVCVLIGSALFLSTRFERAVTSVGAYFAATLPLLPIMWIAESVTASKHIPWTPFSGLKVVLFPAALFTPGPVWAPAVFVTALTGEAVLEFYVLDFGRNPFASRGEPFTTIVFGVIALGIVLYRAHAHAVEREMARLRAERDASRRFLRMITALRDRANTPLQTLEIAIALLHRAPADQALLRRMEHAAARLREINRIATAADGVPADVDTGFDASERLRAVRSSLGQT